LFIFVDQAKQPNKASIFVCITLLFFQHLRRVWWFRTESPEVSFCSSTRLHQIALDGLCKPNLMLKDSLMRQPSARRNQKDTIYCRSAHRQLKQLLLTMSPVREAQSLEDIKKKPKRFSSKHFLSKLLTVDIMLIQQFVLAIANSNLN